MVGSVETLVEEIEALPSVPFLITMNRELYQRVTAAAESKVYDGADLDNPPSIMGVPVQRDWTLPDVCQLTGIGIIKIFETSDALTAWQEAEQIERTQMLFGSLPDGMRVIMVTEDEDNNE